MTSEKYISKNYYKFYCSFLTPTYQKKLKDLDNWLKNNINEKHFKWISYGSFERYLIFNNREDYFLYKITWES